MTIRPASLDWDDTYEQYTALCVFVFRCKVSRLVHSVSLKEQFPRPRIFFPSWKAAPQRCQSLSNPKTMPVLKNIPPPSTDYSVSYYPRFCWALLLIVRVPTATRLFRLDDVVWSECEFLVNNVSIPGRSVNRRVLRLSLASVFDKVLFGGDVPFPVFSFFFKIAGLIEHFFFLHRSRACIPSPLEPEPNGF